MNHPRPRSASSRPDTTPAAGPFRQRVITAALIVAGLIVLLYFLWQAVYVLLLCFAGILLAVLIKSLADALARWTKASQNWSLAIVIVGLALFVVVVVWLSAATLSEQANEFSRQLPQAYEQFQQRLRSYGWGNWLLDSLGGGEAKNVDPRSLIYRAGGWLSNIFNALVALIVIVFVGVYLATEPRLYTDGLLRLVPLEHRDRGAEVLGAIGHTLRWWLIGQGVTMIVIGVLTALGLWLIGVPLWPLLALLAALFNFIPNFGPLVSFVPAVLLAMSDDGGSTKAMWVIGLYIAAQSFEGYVLTPLVQRRAVLLPPALTIATQVLLGVLVGFLGVMLAAPLTASVLVLIKMLYVEEALGDEIKTPLEDMAPKEVPHVPQGREDDEPAESQARPPDQ